MAISTAWKSRWWWWALPLVFCLLNAGFLWFHRSASRSGFAQIQDELVQEEASLRALRQQRGRLRSLLETTEKNRAGIRDLYENRLATEESRFTELVSEVKRLARQAGLEPPNISYSDSEIEDFGLTKKSIVFGVSGDYARIRELVNFLELSELFLVLEEIRLRESDGSRLDIDLVISTLFVEPGELEGGFVVGGAP